MMRSKASAAVVVTSAAAGLATAALIPKAHADGYQSFQSPSENIYCRIEMSDTTALAVCEIRDHTWIAPSPPSSCTLDWGDRVTLRQGSPPQMSCHGDTIQGPAAPVLPYGQTRSSNAITCQSELSGVTCTDNSTGHYFRLARDSYELH